MAACFVYAAFTTNLNSEIPMGGASGAISACMGGFVLLLHRTRIEFKWVLIFFLRIFSGDFFLPAWLVLSFWFLEDIVGMMIGLSEGGSSGGGTAFGAHVGGFIVGMLVIALLKPLLRREAEQEEAEEEMTAAEVAPAAAILGLAPAYATARAVPEEAQLMVYDQGRQSGPFALGQVCQMIQDNTISREAVYWHEGMTDWRTVGEIA